MNRRDFLKKPFFATISLPLALSLSPPPKRKAPIFFMGTKYNFIELDSPGRQTSMLNLIAKLKSKTKMISKEQL